MKAIFSYLQYSNSHFFCDVEMAKISNDLAQRNGYKTCLYTDSYGLELLGSKVNYDEVILFDESILLKFLPEIWSLGKILAMSLTKEPFIHLDFDLFLFDKLDAEIEKKDFFSLYYEPWIHNSIYVQEDAKKIINLYPDKEIKLNLNKFHSYNFSIVGGQKFKEINHVCENIVTFATSYEKNLKQLLDIESWKSPKWIFAVTFEQILIPNMLKTVFGVNHVNIINIPLNLYDDILYDGEIKIDKNIVEYLKNGFISKQIVHLHGEKRDKFNYIKKKLFI